MSFIRRHILYPLYRIYAELFSHFQTKRPIPPIPGHYCGQTSHKERFCPKAKEMGF